MADQQITLDILQNMGDVTGPRDPADARLDPATLEEARLQRYRDAERRLKNPPPLPESGYTLWMQFVSATIQGDHIEVDLVVHGQVQRPEALATASEQVLHLKVPAEVERRLLLPSPSFALGDPVAVLGSAPKRETRGLLGEITRCDGTSGEWAYEVTFGPDGRAEGASWVIGERDLRRLPPSELETRRYKR